MCESLILFSVLDSFKLLNSVAVPEMTGTTLYELQ